MLDIKALSSGGGTTLTAIATIMLGGDGQTTAGVPIQSNARLIAHGGMTTIADTIREYRLLSQDLVDDQNGHYFVLGTSSLIGAILVGSDLPYNKGSRSFAMRQNTGGANNLAFTVDKYTQGVPQTLQTLPAGWGRNQVIISTTYGGALTAITWGSQAFSPTTVPPNGTYAILGAWVNALTNYGLLRFKHSNFGGFTPGFPVKDDTNTTIARAVTPPDNPLWAYPGYQFMALGEMPVFSVSSAGTGLTMEACAITTDTPIVSLNLVKVG